MAYQKSTSTMEKLDPTQLKVFTNIAEGVPMGKPLEVEIIGITSDATHLNLVVTDNFGHQMKLRPFMMDREGRGLSFALRQLLASVTQCSTLFKFLVNAVEGGRTLTDLFPNCKFKVHYELGTGFYVGSYLGKFIVINENYERLSEVNYETMHEARQSGMMMGFKEGWPQTTGFFAPKTTVQETNTLSIEHRLGDEYALDSDTDYNIGGEHAAPKTPTSAKAHHSTNKVERKGTRKVSSSLPKSQRF